MTDGRTDGGDCNIPDAFLKKRGDNNNVYFDNMVSSVVPMIDYNQKPFIYMQPIDDRMELWESIIMGKIFKQMNYILFNPKCNILSNFSYKIT